MKIENVISKRPIYNYNSDTTYFIYCVQYPCWRSVVLLRQPSVSPMMGANRNLNGSFMSLGIILFDTIYLPE